MTIDEAIKELSGIPEHRMTGLDADRADAIQLGIEALKHIKDFRLTYNGEPIYRLLGETPEIDSKRSLHHIKKVLESPLGREPKG